MKSIKYILILLVASTVWSCTQDIDDISIETTTSSSSVVELTEDGRYKVTAQLEGVSMTSVVTRATADEDRIYDGWCLVFGEDQDHFDHEGDGGGDGKYSDNSPLIQLERVTINTNGTFTMVFDEYPNTVFMRIVVNLTDREEEMLSDNITSWRMACTDDGVLDETKFNTPPTFNEVSTAGIATFGQYRHQSVGLDGIYDVDYTTTSDIVDFETDKGGFQNSTSGTTNFEAATSWKFDSASAGYKDVVDYSDYGNPEITSYVQYSVQYKTTGGKDGTSTITNLGESYNENQPDPANPKSTGFPMASYGFVMSSISEETLSDAFGTVVDMIRVCSKVQVEVSDSYFDMEEVYLIDAAQESRIRSSVLANSGTGGTTEVNSSFSIPVDLGGTITYKPLSTENKSSNPIYFYPNSGGGYVYSEGAVNQDINPQYIIIKGQSSNYDTPGYYKVALKAIYPTDIYGNTSGLTYDILRNTSFTVKLLEIDKPGYKTFEDAADPDSPANNISYSMTIESSDNRYEVLVSKGTYYVELETSRVYVKGYMDEGIDGCYVDFTMIPSTGNSIPTVYIQSSDHDGEFDENEDVVVTHCLVMRSTDDGYANDDWTNATQVDPTDNDTEDGLGDQLVKIGGSENATKVRVYFDVNDSGRIRLRIGDMLKFIPIVYDRIPISIYGTKGQDGTEETDTGLVVADTYGTSWDDFSYSQVFYDTDYEGDDAHDYKEGFELNDDGTVTYQNSGDYDTKPELRARIYPTDAGDGNAVLYLRQASDFAVTVNGVEIPLQPEGGESEYYEIIFNSQSVVKSNNTGGLFITNDDNTSVTCDLTSLGTSSVDDVISISIKNEITTTENIKEEDKVGNIGDSIVWENYFNSVITNNDQTLTLTADKIDYEITSTLDVSSESGSTKGELRQEWLEDKVHPFLVTYDNTAKSTITLTNVAGDYKEYIVNQTQYPPLYLVDASGEAVKDYTFDGSTATLYALNVWNSDLIYGYSSNNDTYGYTSKYINDYPSDPFVYSSSYSYCYYDGTLSYPSRNGQTGMRLTTTRPYIFKKAFFDMYDWDSSDDVSGTAVTTTALGGSAKSITPREMWLIGADECADAVIAIVRNGESDGISNSVTNIYYAMMEITITIRDKYDDTYTVTKKLCGIEVGYTLEKFVYPTVDTWDSRWSSSGFKFYGSSTYTQSSAREYNTY